MSTSTQTLPSWILGKPLLDELVATVHSVVLFFSESGVDIPSEVRSLVCAANQEVADQNLLDESEFDIDRIADTEAEISKCYARLRTLADSDNDAEYAGTFIRLRELQESEARRLASVFRAGRRLDPVAAKEALRRADELLAIHEYPSCED